MLYNHLRLFISGRENETLQYCLCDGRNIRAIRSNCHEIDFVAPWNVGSRDEGSFALVDLLHGMNAID